MNIYRPPPAQFAFCGKMSKKEYFMEEKMPEVEVTEQVTNSEEEMEIVDEPKGFIDFIAENNIRFYGTDEQRSAMWRDFVLYIGEVENPTTTKLNPFTQSKYAPLDEVLNTTRPVLAKHNLGITQVPINGEDGFVYAQTILIHGDGGTMIYPPFGVPTVKRDAQGVIAALTYARRGAINPILATHGEADDDGNAAAGKTGKPVKGEEVNKELADKRAEVLAFMKEKSAELGKEPVFAACKKVCRSTNPNSLSSIEDCEKVIQLINEIKKESK